MPGSPVIVRGVQHGPEPKVFKNADSERVSFRQRSIDCIGGDERGGIGWAFPSADQRQPDCLDDFHVAEISREQAAAKPTNARAGLAFKLGDQFGREPELTVAIAEEHAERGSRHCTGPVVVVVVVTLGLANTSPPT